jgi:hypothetical protein
LNDRNVAIADENYKRLDMNGKTRNLTQVGKVAPHELEIERTMIAEDALILATRDYRYY